MKPVHKFFLIIAILSLANSPTSYAAPISNNVSISGIITDWVYRTVPNAKVTCIIVENDGYKWKSRYTAQCDKNGIFHIAIPKSEFKNIAYPLKELQVAAETKELIGFNEEEVDSSHLRVTMFPKETIMVQLLLDGKPAEHIKTLITSIEHETLDNSNYYYLNDFHQNKQWTTETNEKGIASFGNLPEDSHIDIDVLGDQYTEPSYSDNNINQNETIRIYNIYKTGSLHGCLSCIDPSTPLGNITVEIYDEKNRLSYHAITNTNGCFTINRIRPSTYCLSVDIPASLSSNWTTQAIENIKIDAGKTTDNIIIPLIKGGVITGTVYNKDTHEPVPNIEVTAEGSKRTSIKGITNASGVYRLQAPRDTYHISIHHLKALSGYYSTVVTNGQNIQLDLDCWIKGYIEGDIISSQTQINLSEIYFFAVASDDHARSGSNKCNKNGHFSLPVPSGRYSVYATLPPPSSSQWISEQLDNIEVKTGKSTNGLKIRLKKGNMIIGTVTLKNTHRPAPNIPIEISVNDRYMETTYTNIKGVYSMMVPDCNYAIFVPVEDIKIERKEGYIKDGKTIQIDYEIDPFDKVLFKQEKYKGYSVQGQIHDNHGKPIAGIIVEASLKYEYLDSKKMETKTDSNGHYSFTDLDPRAECSITANSKDYTCAVEKIKPPYSNNITVDLTVEPYDSFIAGRIVDLNHKPVKGVLVKYDYIKSCLTDENGHFRIEKVPEGRIGLFIEGTNRSIFDNKFIMIDAISGKDDFEAVIDKKDINNPND